MYYFAYGSNMDPERMRERLGRQPDRKAATLADWMLKFNKITSRNPQEGYANIGTQDGEKVEGILYDITTEELRKMDLREGYPIHYNRINIVVRTEDDKEIEVITYIAQPSKVREGLRPSREYLNHLLAARELLSLNYIRKLEAIRTID
jgi:cation transport regulator ChaC